MNCKLTRYHSLPSELPVRAAHDAAAGKSCARRVTPRSCGYGGIKAGGPKKYIVAFWSVLTCTLTVAQDVAYTVRRTLMVDRCTQFKPFLMVIRKPTRLSCPVHPEGHMVYPSMAKLSA